jgi:hypothetical protein
MIINIPKTTSNTARTAILRQCAHVGSSITIRRITAANVIIIIGGTPGPYGSAAKAYDIASAVVQEDSTHTLSHIR